MSKGRGKSHKLPPLVRHKRGLGRVRIGGKDFYLGAYDSEECQEAYRRLTAEWIAQGSPTPWSGSGRIAANGGGNGEALSVAELTVRYLRFAAGHYQKDGKATSELSAVKRALGYVHELYSGVMVTEFGPLALKACRARMVRDALARKTVNAYVARVRRMFRWGVENELVPVTVYQALQAMAGLRRGRTEAREVAPILPVEQKAVEAVLPHLSRQVAAMVQLQDLTGMRPGEVIQMRACDLSTGETTWRYRPESHKTEHRGKGRVVLLGPKAQAILRPFLQRNLQRYLFSPKDAEEERQAARREAATTPRPYLTKRRKTRQRPPLEQYSVGSYRRAVQRACEDAEVEVWSPNQLRHSAATRIRAGFGIEAARVILGHSSAVTSEIYAEKDEKAAAQIMGQIG